MEFTKKIPGTLLALLMYYVLPLAGNIALIANWLIWIPMAVCSIVYLTQPSTSSDQIRNPEDKNSMLYLALATSLSQIWVVIEWAYFNKSNGFQFDIFSAIGGFLMLSGFAVRWWAIKVLDKHFSNDVRLLPDHELIQSGPYAYVRHPSYTGAFFIAVGISVFLHAWTGTLAGMAILFAAYAYRIDIEESELIKKFGKKYVDYQQRTKKVLPFIW